MSFIQTYNDLKNGGNIPTMAINEAASSNMPGKDGGPYDAYRHLLWTAEMTRRYGEQAARNLGKAHEIEGDFKGQKPENRAMDELNNELGYAIGREANSWRDVVNKARGLMGKTPEDGGPVILPPDKWRHSDTDPNPAPRDSNGNPLPPDKWNWPEPDFPDGPHPLPPRLPSPPDGTMPSDVPHPMGDPYTGMPWPGSENQDSNGAPPSGDTYRIVYYSDPLILDLDGDGIETVAEQNFQGVLFDTDSDGIRTATGWVKKDDGFLTRDINGNGTIDSGAELFGDSTLLANGSRAIDGFNALEELDINQDGTIDSSDTAFAELKIWQDINQNGISELGPVHTIEAHQR